MGKSTRGEDGGAATGLVAEVTGLTKRFGARVAVAEASLTLRAGEVMGFVGPNGAGKTTTLRMLAGLLKPDSGSGQVLGFDLMRNADEVRAAVGYMPQKLALYGELSVTENLRFRAEVYGLRKPAAAVAEMLEVFGLEGFARQRAGWLSGGWARRLQFAASVLHRPKLMLLDEPTAGLDAIAKLEVWRRVAGFAAEGAAVVINTHDLIEAEQCSRISLFSAGEIISRGAPDEVTGALRIGVLSAAASGAAATAAIEALPHVIAVYPDGRRLRVIAAPENLDDVSDAMRGMGLSLEAASVRLEDVEFAMAAPLGLVAEAVS